MRPFDGTNASNVVHGVIAHDQQAPLDHLIVEISNLGDGALVWKGPVSPAGGFDVPSIALGAYVVRVTGLAGRVLAEEMVHLNSPFETIEISLTTSADQSPREPTVSIAQLGHKVPGKAHKEALLAQKDWKKENYEGCIKHLEKAITIDPDYLEARRNLGLVYVRLNRPQNVILAFQEVLKIDPRSADAYASVSVAEAQLNHLAESEAAARRGLSVDPANRRSRYMLGLLLAEQKKDDATALRYLKQSYVDFPSAHLVVAQVLARQGQVAEARRQLEDYLDIAPASQRSEVKLWLKKLKQ